MFYKAVWHVVKRWHRAKILSPTRQADLLFEPNVDDGASLLEVRSFLQADDIFRVSVAVEGGETLTALAVQVWPHHRQEGHQ